MNLKLERRGISALWRLATPEQEESLVRLEAAPSPPQGNLLAPCLLSGCLRETKMWSFGKYRPFLDPNT